MSLVGKRLAWIKMPLGMVLGIGPGDFMLDGKPCSPYKGGTPQLSAHVYLWPNGWMDQDATWYGGRPRPRRHCVRWGPAPPKGYSHQFRLIPIVDLWPNGWIHRHPDTN